MEFLNPIFFFTLAIAVVVGFHEYGHFVAARLSGVKVDVFSIGMGPKVFSRTSSRTGITYQLAALPIGGFVKMWESSTLKDTLKREPTIEEEGLCFDKASVTKRFFIVANGPFFNFILAVIGYSVISYALTVEPRTIIGNILPDSVMERSGFQTGDHILSINGKNVSDWEGVALSLSISSGGRDEMPVTVIRDNAESVISLRVSGTQVTRDKHVFDVFGFYPIHASGTNQVTEVLPGSIADNAGLRAGDTIITAGTCDSPNLRSLISCLNAAQSGTILLTVDRNNSTVDLEAQWLPGSSLGVNTQSLASAEHFSVVKDKSFGVAFLEGLQQSYDVTNYTVESIYKLFTGKLSADLVGGPVTLAKAAEASASHGLYQFINFLCIFSISLMVLNLIPIPPLDGGHLFLNAVEVVANKSVAEWLTPFLIRIGILFIGFLMIFAIGNDIYHEII